MSDNTTLERLTSLEGEMRAMREIWKLHTSQDMEQFQRLSTQLEGIDTKVDSLLIREAHRDGEFAGLKRSAIIASSSIAFVVSVIGLATTLFVN